MRPCGPRNRWLPRPEPPRARPSRIDEPDPARGIELQVAATALYHGLAIVTTPLFIILAIFNMITGGLMKEKKG